MFLDGIKSWSYKGEFFEDNINGNGKFKWNEQKIYNGSWVNNELSGYGILIDGNNKYIGYLENNMKNGYGASFYNSQNAILGFWQNDLIEGYAILILINNNPEKNKKIIQISSEENDNSSEESKSDFKYIKTLKGEIIKGNLEQDELNEFKLSKEYDDMIQLYNDKILPDFEQNLEESKSEENQSSSFFGNF